MVWILGAYAVMSAITLLAYALDKRRARRGSARARESTLHLLALLGGVPGALLAQSVLRHKNRKRAFVAVTWMTALLHAGLWSWWLLEK